MDISVVVPLYNEEESLEELMQEIDREMKAHQFTYEVVMIDDGSNDGSWAKVNELKLTYPAIRGVRFQRNYGKSAALHTGFQEAEGDVVITMDADGQDNPIEIAPLYKLIVEDGYDLVSGWKKKRYDPLGKRLPSRFFNWVARKVSGIHLHDFNCGLKAYKNIVVKSIEIYGGMHRYIPMIAKWEGFPKIHEKEVEHRARKHGVSKYGAKRLINGFLDLITVVVINNYLKNPMRFFGTWGVFFSFIGALDLGYLFFIKLGLGESLGERMPAMFFGSVTLLMGFILFSTGLLAELISR
ncbi:MAG: glycosyltransferase family 2 protein, partial [Bacteroidetes bacterium]|nr:glycosyltransferase family 2 protein [Bacteroidota bacterium]